LRVGMDTLGNTAGDSDAGVRNKMNRILRT
jgi:hypothetical protein